MDEISLNDSPKKLTKKQIRFAQAYAQRLNGAWAGREAGVPPDSARQTAYKWLHDSKFAHVQEYVDELLEDDAIQRKIDHSILRHRLRSRLSIDQRRFWTKDGQPRNPRKLSMEMAQHVQGYTYSEFRTFSKTGSIVQEGSNASLTLSSDKKAEEMLGRHSGFFNRETAGDQFNDYLQADSQLEASLSQLPGAEDDLDDDDEASEEETAGEATL